MPAGAGYPTRSRPYPDTDDARVGSLKSPLVVVERVEGPVLGFGIRAAFAEAARRLFAGRAFEVLPDARVHRAGPLAFLFNSPKSG